MTNKFLILIKKDFKSTFRNAEGIIGILSFNVLITILVTFFYRSVDLRISEISVFCLPLVWTIYILTIMKLVLQLLLEESSKRIYLNQIKDGFTSSDIFLSKLSCIIVIGTLVAMIQMSLFTLLLGFTDYLNEMIKFCILCVISLPAISSLSIISSLISQRSSNEELLMPVLTLPLLIFISISVLTYAELVIHSNAFDYSNFWFKAIIATQFLYVSLCNILFESLCKMKS